MTTAELEEIRAADTAMGEDLQMFPVVYTHRRALLATLDALERLLAVTAPCTLCWGAGHVTVNAGPHAGEVHECPNGCKVNP